MGRFVALYWKERRAPFTHRLTPCWAGLQSQRPLRMIALERQAEIPALKGTSQYGTLSIFPVVRFDSDPARTTPRRNASTLCHCPMRRA
jgi:hypothetical protein